MKNLINFVINSLKTPSEEPAIDGLGAILPLKQPKSDVISTSVQNAAELALTRAKSSTTSSPLYSPAQVSQDGTYMQPVSSAMQEAFKYSAQCVMTEKQEKSVSNVSVVSCSMHGEQYAMDNGQCMRCSTENEKRNYNDCNTAFEKEQDGCLDQGVKYDQNKPSLAYIPYAALKAEGEAFGYGARKYAPFNYTNGIKVTRTLSAALRHIYQFLSGEDIDSESGVHHLGCARANLAMALDTLANHKEFDDRSKK